MMTRLFLYLTVSCGLLCCILLFPSFNYKPETSRPADNAWLADSILALGRQYIVSDRTDSAHQLLKYAIEETKDTASFSLAYLVSQAAGAETYADIIPILQDNLPVSDTPDWWLAKGYLLLAEAYLATGKADKAAPLFYKAKDLATAIDDPPILAFAYIGQAACAYYEGEYLEMERRLSYARDLALKSLPDEHKALSTCDHLFGVLYQVNGNYDKALEVSLRVLNRMKENSTDDLLPYYVNTGTIYLEKGDYAYAISYFNQAISKGGQANPSMIATCYNNIGQARRRLNQTDEAIIAFRQSIALYEKADRPSDRTSLSDAYNNLASCYLSRKQPDSALTVIEQARKKIPSAWSLDPLSWHTLGVIQMKRNKPEIAEPYLHTSLRLHKEKYGYGHPYQATIYTDLAKMASLKNNNMLAISQIDSALAIADPNDGYEQKGMRKTGQVATWYALKEKAYILMKMAEHDSVYLKPALLAHSRSALLLDNIRKTLSTDESGAAWSVAAHPVLESGIQVASQIYKLSGREAFMEDALHFAEKNKSVKLLESTLEAIAALDDASMDSLLDLEEKINRELAIYRRNLAGRVSESKERVWKEKVFELSQTQDSLITALRKGTPAYYRQRYLEEGLHTDSIRQLFTSSGDLFIEYFIGSEQVWAIWLTSDEKGIFSLEGPDVLRADVADYLQAISNRPSLSAGKALEEYVALTSLGHSLYDKLLAPAMKNLPPGSAGRMIIIPDGYLSFLPFESLLTKKPDPAAPMVYSTLPYLLENYTVSYAYSAGLLLSPEMPGHSAEAGKGIGIYAPYTSAQKLTIAQTTGCEEGKLYALSCSDREIKGIGAYMHGETVEGDKATRSHFQQFAGDYQILHLATHACLDPNDPGLNRVYLADDYLTTSELYGMKLNARLAVLSACNTGSGELVAGEGVMSLGRGLAYAGVQSMVTSLWPIDDCTTSDLMVSFYKELLGDEPKPKDEALRMAKINFMQSSEDILTHPYYWAAFVHTGKWEAFEKDTISPDTTLGFVLKWWHVAGLAVCLTLMVIFGRKMVA